MAGTSWEHQSEVRDALQTIVSDPQLGAATLSSAQTMSNLLKDLLPDAPRETSVLVAAAEAGLAQALLDHVGQGMDIGTASSLTASAFSARTPFTADACRWVVGELSVALGLAPGEQSPAGGAATGPSPADEMQATQPAAPAARQDLRAQPGYGAVPGTGPPGAGYGYPPPPAPAYGYPPPPAPGAGAPASPGQGRAPKQRRTPKAWMILTAAVAIVVLIGVIVVVARATGNSGTAIEPLSRIIKPDVTSCKTESRLGMRGVTVALGCRTHQAPVGLLAYQFSTAADYRSGLSRLNDLTGWNPSGAGTGCPPHGGSNSAQTGWHSNVNPKYAARQGQILECYPDSHNAGILIYLWTLPTQRVILVGSEGPTGATFSSLETWWAGLTYG